LQLGGQSKEDEVEGYSHEDGAFGTEVHRGDEF
jgi:hypothetical protein